MLVEATTHVATAPAYKDSFGRQMLVAGGKELATHLPSPAIGWRRFKERTEPEVLQQSRSRLLHRVDELKGSR